MLREPPQREPHDHLGGALRPVPLPLDRLQPLQESAKVEQEVGELVETAG